jgi:hypothetical protein
MSYQGPIETVRWGHCMLASPTYSRSVVRLLIYKVLQISSHIHQPRLPRLVCIGTIDAAGIFNIHGTSDRVATPGVQVSPHEAQEVLGALQRLSGLCERLLRKRQEICHGQDGGQESVWQASMKTAQLTRARPALSSLRPLRRS